MASLVLIQAEQIGKEISSRLATIKIADGFETDLGTKVWRGRRKIPADDELPVAIITEGDDTPGDKAGRHTQQIMQTFVIDGFDACDPDNPNDKAHAMIRDIKKVIFGDGGQFGGKVRSVSYLGRDIGPRPDGAGFVQARILIEVEYAEDLSKP